VGRRWRWFLWPGRVAVDLTGQVVPGEEPGRFRRLTVEDGVPDGLVTSRCDGALVYERPDCRRAAGAANQHAERYGPMPPRRAKPGAVLPASRRRRRADG
jgi:hypothetical protein